MRLRGLGPAMPTPPGREIARAAVGAALGLLLTDLVLWGVGGVGAQPLTHVALVAPFGATAYLIFTLPNSPLAQPWSAVVGNTLSALAALVVLRLGLPMVAATSLAVLGAMAAMALARAMHPPGGAVAIATVLLADKGAPPGPEFLLQPIFLGSACLVLAGVAWNRATGRRYPLRQPSAAPAQRQTPGPLALATALDRLRMGANLGVEDLSRLMAAAEAISTASNLGPMNAAQVMSRDLIVLRPDMPLSKVADVFRQTGYRHLPLVDAGDFLGLVPQTALLGPLPDLPLFRLAERVEPVSPDTPLADVLGVMASGRQVCIPVTEGGALRGLITRTDLLAAMTHGPIARQDRRAHDQHL